MYGTPVLFCLLLTSSALASNNASAEGNIRPFEDRSAKDGVYIGCFANGCLKFDYHRVILNSTTPDSCTASCKENGFAFAAVYNRTKCACSCEQTCLTQRLDDNECGYPCRSAWRRLCGGFNGASLYAVPSISTSKSRCVENSHENDTSTWLDEASSLGYNPNLAIPVSIPTIICIVIIVFICRRRRRLLREAIPQPTSIQRKDPKDRSYKHRQGLTDPPSGLPAPPDAFVPHPMPQNTSDKHLYHHYAEAEQHGSSTPHPPHGHIPSSASSAITSPYAQSTPNICKKRNDSNEYHEYAYADQIKPKPEIPDKAGATDEEGYIIIIPDGPSPSPNPQEVYYSSRIPGHHGKDDVDQLKSKPKTSDSAVTNDGEEYVVPDHADGSSQSHTTQVLYYSSRIPRGPGKDKVPPPRRTSPTVYYSSSIYKPKGNKD